MATAASTRSLSDALAEARSAAAAALAEWERAQTAISAVTDSTSAAGKVAAAELDVATEEMRATRTRAAYLQQHVDQPEFTPAPPTGLPSSARLAPTPEETDDGDDDDTILGERRRQPLSRIVRDVPTPRHGWIDKQGKLSLSLSNMAQELNLKLEKAWDAMDFLRHPDLVRVLDWQPAEAEALRVAYQLATESLQVKVKV